MRVVESVARRFVRALDAGANRVYGWRWNPIHQSGVLAVWLLVLLTATGLYLLLYYRVGAPAHSVARIASDPWLGAWMRTLHRYATDAFVIAAVLHALRLFGQSRSWGPRTRAWVSGVFLLTVALVCTWTGFVMAWDSFGQRLAIAGGRLFDTLPILSEPVSRIFAGDRPVPSAFFFINLFAHIALPLVMGAALWLHVSRVARPVLLPPRRLRWWVAGALLALSVLVPARLGPPADPFALPQSTPLDLITTWWLPWAEHTTPWIAWAVALGLTVFAVSVPLWTRREREGSWSPSFADPRLCTGCDQCTQDCPWEAITMVPRQDDRPTLLASVDPNRCVSCGICAGSCAPMGVGPPGLTGREQLSRIRESLLSEVVGDAPNASIVVVCCAQAPASVRRRLASTNVRVHDVPCTGNLHSSVLELLVRHGAGGVLVAGCPPRDCVGREGPKWLTQRMYHDREAELQERVDRRRVRVATFAPGCDAESLAAVEAFRRDIASLAVPEAERDVRVEAECEPSAAEGGVE